MEFGRLTVVTGMYKRSNDWVGCIAVIFVDVQHHIMVATTGAKIVHAQGGRCEGEEMLR
jgi:hypothetical protein